MPGEFEKQGRIEEFFREGDGKWGGKDKLSG
jgi:hypothetical protein